MEDIRAYILSVTAAAILCAMVNALSAGKGSGGAIVKLVTGIIMAAVIVQPLGSTLALNLQDRFRDLNREVTAAVALGTETARTKLADSIKERTESYILDKAAELEADIQIQVILDEGDPPVPVAVVIEGAVSPAARTALVSMITRDLGIPEEELTWT